MDKPRFPHYQLDNDLEDVKVGDNYDLYKVNEEFYMGEIKFHLDSAREIIRILNGVPDEYCPVTAINTATLMMGLGTEDMTTACIPPKALSLISNMIQDIRKDYAEIAVEYKRQEEEDKKDG